MGRIEMARAARSSLGVCRAGLGIASAIEPAGGVSPLRGGAWILFLTYRQGACFSYRSPIGS